MKKTFLFLCAVFAVLLSMQMFAAEVIYENDFSDPSTLSDFKQYRMEWEIRDGGLYLTENMNPAIKGQDLASTFSHIIYQADSPLSEYVVEVDYMNIQTAGGVIVNAQQDKVNTNIDGYYGYITYTSNDATKATIGCVSTEGKWLGNFNVGAGGNMNLGSNVHIKATVKDGKVQVLMTNIDSGAVVYQYTHTIAASAKDAGWSEGTVGLRMRAQYAPNLAVSAGNAYFDNFKVTTVDAPATPAPAQPVTPATPSKPASTDASVIYENDFSDASTLADFKQYRMDWEIRDGGLYLTGDMDPNIKGQDLASTFSHIIYQADAPLSEYVVEVDYMNIQTAGGVIVNAQQDKVNTNIDGYYGYIAYTSNDATKATVGCVSAEGKWLGTYTVGAAGNMNVGSNVHIKATVKGGKMHVLMTNIDTGAVVYEYTHTMTASSKDAGWKEGTVGLRMRAQYGPNLAVSAGNAYFDNFKVTTVPTVAETPATPAVPETPATPATPAVNPKADFIDTSSLVEVYRNGFDSADSITDFTQFRGAWTVFSGRLYLSAITGGGQSYILYEGDKALTELGDYVVDVDMYNTQSQGGLIVRSDVGNVTGDTDDGIMGYMGFIGFAGTQAAIGAGKADGQWLTGNIEVSPNNIIKPGMNIHLQMAVKGDVVQYTVTDIDTGKELWKWAEHNSLWTKGSFGFRLYGKISNGLDNINQTAFDNLVVSTFGDAKASTEVKLQIGNMTGYVNGVAKALDAAPIIRNSRTMLPVRFVAEALGATVGWDGATSTVTVTTDTTKLEIKIGATTAKINGAEVTLDSPAFIENSRTYLPVRFVAENLGATVAWDGTTSTATLTK